MANTIDFIVKNGLQVTTNLVVGTYTANNTPVLDGAIISGSVGIGTFNPLSKLHTYGNIQVTNTATISGIVFADGTFQGTASAGGGTGSGTVSAGTLGEIGFYAANGTTISGTATFVNLNSNVGIGTANPAANIHIGNAPGIGYPNIKMITSSNSNSYVQSVTQNFSAGAFATSDIVATADIGTDTTYYIDAGIANSGYNNLTAPNSLGTSLYPRDGYLYVQGGVNSLIGGNLTIGTTSNATNVNIITGGLNSANISAVFGANLISFFGGQFQFFPTATSGQGISTITSIGSLLITSGATTEITSSGTVVINSNTNINNLYNQGSGGPTGQGLLGQYAQGQIVWGRTNSFNYQQFDVGLVRSGVIIDQSGTSNNYVNTLEINTGNVGQLGNVVVNNVYVGQASSTPLSSSIVVGGVFNLQVSNAAGVNFNFVASQGSGSGEGGSLVFQVAPANIRATTNTANIINASTNILVLDSTRTATFTSNIKLANTAVTSGIVFADGTFQATANVPGPTGPTGTQGTPGPGNSASSLNITNTSAIATLYPVFSNLVASGSNASINLSTGFSFNPGGNLLTTNGFVYSSNALITPTVATLSGVIESDGNVFYGQTSTVDGRGIIPHFHINRIVANSAAFGTTTASPYFGATSNVTLVHNSTYEFEFNLYFTKTTAGTITFSLVSGSAPVNLNAYYVGTVVTGVGTVGAPQMGAVVASVATTSTLPVTGSLTTAVNHYYNIRGIIDTNATTDAKFDIFFIASAGTITPLRGSYYKITRLSNTFTGNVGIFS